MAVDLGTAAATGWRLGFRSLEHEVTEPLELPVAGTLPAELDGTLYRIGPARHDVYGERYRHWFDGDGMVHALRVSGGGATYRNRFVDTDKKRDEDAAGARLYGGFGTPPAGSALTRLRHVVPKSAANTNIVSHAGRLLALWEAGRPWRVDPETLETLGEDDLGGVLGPRQALSAHPKLDRATGEMWNFGVDYGARPAVSLYRTTSAGATDRVARIPMPFAAMVHDFAVTPTKVVLLFAPLALPTLPVGLLSGRRSFGESLRWHPDKGTVVVVWDRRTAEVREHATAAFLFFHTANAWDEDDGTVTVDLCSYADTSVMRLLGDVMVGRAVPSPARLERLRIGDEVERQVVGGAGIEFPRVAPGTLGAQHTRVYGVAHRPGDEFLGVPAVVDTVTGAVRLGPTAPGQFAGELVPVAKPGSSSEDDVWLLTLVLDAEREQTQLWVLDGGDIEAPPVAVVTLPHIVPFGFHGNWVRNRAG